MADALEPTRITTLAQLDDLLKASFDENVWLFKHSLICPASSSARSEFQRFAARQSRIVAAEIEIQRARGVSRAVETRTGVRHESPQVLLIREGAPIWNASHWTITESALEEAAAAHAVLAPVG